MGLKSEKLRPFWLSLRHDEKQKYEQVLLYFVFQSTGTEDGRKELRKKGAAVFNLTLVAAGINI